MTHKHLRFGKGFSVALSNRRAQAATMVIAPGDAEGGPDNRHRGADQWLFVLAGNGRATVAGRRRQLRAGSLLLIERGSTHEIRNTGRAPLKTLTSSLYQQRRPSSSRPLAPLTCRKGHAS